MSVTETRAAHARLENWRRASYFGLWGASGGLVGAILSEILGLGGEPAAFIGLLVKVGVWFSIIGAMIAIA
jgi:hypothetical protein